MPLLVMHGTQGVTLTQDMFERGYTRQVMSINISQCLRSAPTLRLSIIMIASNVTKLIQRSTTCTPELIKLHIPRQ